MVFYSFYTDWQKTEANLVFRTEDENNPDEKWSKQQSKLKMFNDKREAELDFFALLYENEDFRIKEYVDTSAKVKVKRTAKVTMQKVPVVYEKIEDHDFVKNFIYNENCEATMARMPNNFVDYIITSPPYNVGKGIRGAETEGLYDVYEDDLSDDEYYDWLCKIIDECLRVTRKHVFFNIQMLGKNKRTILKLQGKYYNKIKDVIIWNKKIAPPHIQKGVMNSKFEYIFIFSNQKPESKKFDDGNFQGNFNNVIEGMNASRNEYAKLNKATFPLYLPRTILRKFGNKGDIIYDPFNGTGTTALACIMEDRDLIGSELDPAQCDVTNRRLREERSKIKLELEC